MPGIVRAARTRLGVGRDLFLEPLQARFILHIDLHHPRGLVLLGDGLRQGGLEGIAQLRHIRRGARLGPGRSQFKQGADAHAILEQKGAARRVVFHPGQQIGERRRALIQLPDLSRGHRRILRWLFHPGGR